FEDGVFGRRDPQRPELGVVDGKEVQLHQPQLQPDQVVEGTPAQPHQAESLGMRRSARPSRKARRRSRASGVAVVMEDISDSTKRPSSCPMSWMRGSALITAKLLSGALPAARRASSLALSSASPAPTRYWQSPIRCPSSAVSTRPVSIMSVMLA